MSKRGILGADVVQLPDGRWQAIIKRNSVLVWDRICQNQHNAEIAMEAAYSRALRGKLNAG